MKQISIALQNHYNSGATTWCYLVRVACVGKFAGRVIGFTTLDDNLTVDDGQGPVVYHADRGVAPSKFQNSADFSVDNADISGWVQADGISEEDIIAGIFDFAEVTIYRCNYEDLSQGLEVVNYGSFGKTIWKDTAWRNEFRSLMQQAKQPTGDLYSLTCRNRYGDAKCKKAFEWFEAEVTAVGDDATLEITCSDLDQDDGYFVPGVLEVLEGGNAGADMDVDEFLEGGIIRLAMQLPRPFQVGDTVRIRVDCDKTFETCRDVKGNHLEFRGEHLTPVGETGLNVPGAQIPEVDAS